MSIERFSHNPRSHLFTIRVWQEEIDVEKTEWRGKVQLFTNKDVRYFREWSALLPLLLTMLSETDIELSKQQEDVVDRNTQE